jgi:hypothetical protein
MTTIKTIGVIAFIFLAFGIAGHMDYEDAIQQDLHYCDMVREGHWPNFKPEIDCKRINQEHMVRGIKL